MQYDSVKVQSQGDDVLGQNIRIKVDARALTGLGFYLGLLAVFDIDTM
jgi:hypothetical protein